METIKMKLTRAETIVLTKTIFESTFTARKAKPIVAFATQLQMFTQGFQDQIQEIKKEHAKMVQVEGEDKPLVTPNGFEVDPEKKATFDEKLSAFLDEEVEIEIKGADAVSGLPAFSEWLFDEYTVGMEDAGYLVKLMDKVEAIIKTM